MRGMGRYLSVLEVLISVFYVSKQEQTYDPGYGKTTAIWIKNEKQKRKTIMQKINFQLGKKCRFKVGKEEIKGKI